MPLMEGSWGRDVHPRSTNGVLIRIYPDDSFTESAQGGSAMFSGIERLKIAVHDLAEGMRAYGEGLGLDLVSHDEETAI